MRAAVVAAGALQRRGHRVPARAPAAEQVERGELPGDGEGVAVGGRDCADEAELAGGCGQRREDRQRLEAVEEMRDRLVVDVEPVGDEGEGDAVLLGLAGIADEEVEIDAGVRGVLGWRQAFMWLPAPWSIRPKVRRVRDMRASFRKERIRPPAPASRRRAA